MTESTFDSEDLLQKHLAELPDLLAGEQINSLDPRRWLLISREVSLPSDETGMGRWSVDHLFVDQDGVPTIVEVKRSTNTGIRREIVGQMLEYAANAVIYWPIQTLRDRFEKRCVSGSLIPEEVLQSFIGLDRDVDQFWQDVKINLQAGKIRMIFVADHIPAELQRIVEFLSSQLDPAEVFAVEVKQYLGNEHHALVPRLVGQTVLGRTFNERTQSQWNADTIADALRGKKGPAEEATFRKIVDWAASRSLRPWYGRGKNDGSLFPILDQNGIEYRTFAVWTYGTVAVQLGWMQTYAPFDSEELRLELLRRLNTISEINISEDRITKYPSFSLSTLTSDSALEQFLATFDWYIETVRSWYREASEQPGPA